MTAIPSRPVIWATELRKSFGDQVVLDGIDLDVPEGPVFSLLGPNGAGKTTTVQILGMPCARRRAEQDSGGVGLVLAQREAVVGGCRGCVVGSSPRLREVGACSTECRCRPAVRVA